MSKNTNINNDEVQVKKYEYLLIITHLLIGVLFLFITYLCLTNQLRLFTLHPILAIAFFLLMAEGLLVMRLNNPITKGLSYSTKVKYHWIVQLAGLFCGVSSFIVININKNINQSINDEPLHGLFGFSSLILCVVTCLGGVLIIYNVTFRGLVKLSLVKFAHKSSGTVTFGICSLAILSSYYTLWFQSHVNGFIIIICTFTVLTIMLSILSQSFGILRGIVKNMLPKSK